MELVIFVGKDRENLGQASALINRMECEKIVLVKDKEASDIQTNSKCVTVEVDSGKSLHELKSEIQEKLKRELSGEFEVALSIASGSGKEHMALISALLNLPVGIKLVAYTKNGIEFFT
jgi:hypothetical protein